MVLPVPPLPLEAKHVLAKKFGQVPSLRSAARQSGPFSPGRA